MKDKVLTRAIFISIAAHLVVVLVVARTWSTRLNASPIKQTQQRLMNVDLVKDPYAEPPKPKPVAVRQPKPDKPAPEQKGLLSNIAKAFAPRPAPPRYRATNSSAAGGALNTGTPSKNGDIALRNGHTPVGVVPGSDDGKGSGHGDRPGVNNSDPPPPPPVKPADVQPASPPPPPPPPEPKKVTRTVCTASRLLAGQHCKDTRSATFTEGDERHRTCDRCKAPEPVHVPRIADRTLPVLTRDVKPRVPDSIDEGLTLQTEIEYYVEADGSVSQVRVTRSSGNRDWDRAVTAAASQWRYSPAVQGGVPQRVKVTRRVGCKT